MNVKTRQTLATRLHIDQRKQRSKENKEGKDDKDLKGFTKGIHLFTFLFHFSYLKERVKQVILRSLT